MDVTTKFNKEYTLLKDGRVEEKQVLNYMGVVFTNFITDGIKFCNYKHFGDQIIERFDVEEDSELSEHIIEACNQLDLNTESAIKELNSFINYCLLS